MQGTEVMRVHRGGLGVAFDTAVPVSQLASLASQSLLGR